MANLQNDIAAGIATILSLSAFDAVLREGKAASDVVQTGYTKDGDPYGKYNGIRIVPGSFIPDPDNVLDDSAATSFNFGIAFDINDLSRDNHLKMNAMHQLMVSKFGDNGTTLSASIIDNGPNILDGTRVTTILSEAVPEPLA